MRALVIGSGAREHAIVRGLLGDPDVTQVDAAPGNPGIAAVAECHPLPDLTDGAAVADLARSLGSDLVVVGPEAPLVAGVADAVRDAGIAAFGPSAEAAQLEGSKAFAKEIMAAADVPTARSYVCADADEARAALGATGAPYVVKDDGLAAGKGVVVTDSLDAALEHAAGCFAGGGTIVIEEFLSGPEVSLFCITDGATVRPLAPAQDFKRARDGDEGPNTGGMGAYSPLPWAPDDLVDDVVARIAQPTIDEMRRRGTPFAGVLYVGLALTPAGPRVIEFNARFGDPETQVVLARLRTPLGALLRAAADGTLEDLPPLVWQDDAAVTVVIASEGYPAAPRTGDVISGADGEGSDAAYLLHAGTARDDAGSLVSSGGRVLSAVGVGTDLAAARAAAYEVVAGVQLRGSHHRTDIAQAAADGTLTVPTA
ncbi:phosphoribosylamine--glycine ligase [Flexivirga endophytica]|uniref:Phosphoribosylamine--glycine ligase n=1 Tax=Flexivirga endophytica TaxID=1849103 RepID=A0A916T244_9MICO|nr:phosphoribosylamine--glycine ligase [Flexivirga endophytica]GGB29063.1 phosphoribosylamine--glycine ligase [Flexivirga endophytica]GHB50113.1 phosphoribosylamine--glycine ligase [Flexivirga endophytica]